MISHVAFEDRKANAHDLVVQSRWNTLEQEHAIPVRDFLSFEHVMEVNPFEVRPHAAQVRRAFARRFQRTVELFELKSLLERRLMSLSNGETQRVQLARALCRPVHLLILDEPFIGLDATTRRHFHHALQQLMRTSIRVLLITTRPEELPRQISHVLWVEDCRVTESGPRAALALTKSKHIQPSDKPDAITKNKKVRQMARLGDANTLIQLRDVTVRYGKRTILHHLNWTVLAGESWALLGPNGSGKTTLLSLLSGDNPQAYRNEVVVFGVRRGGGESIWGLKQRIGWISPELQAYFPQHIAVSDAVASGFHETAGLFEPVNRAQRDAVQQWLRRFELADHALQPLFALSAGLQRMALLARALVKRPDLLLLDEPCQGLDVEHRRLLIGTIDALIRARETTVIYVSHRQDEIPPSIGRVLRLRDGRGRAEHRRANSI